MSISVSDRLSGAFVRRIKTARGAHMPRALFWGTTIVVLASCAISLALMHEFRSMGFFYLDDTLFNSDPKSMLDVFGQGERSKSILFPQLRNSIHPYLWLYFGPAIRLAAKAATVLGLSDLNEIQLRAYLGTYVSPIVAAIQLVAFGALMASLGLRPRHVLLMTAISATAFTNLIFSSIPEHFAITNLAITWFLLLSVHAFRTARPGVTPGWIALGLFGAGVTITNAIVLGIIHALTAIQIRTQGIVMALSKSLVLGVSVAFFVLASAYGLGLAIDGPLPKGSVRDNYVPRYVRVGDALWTAPLRALGALGNAIAPNGSDIRPISPTPVPSPFDPALTAPFDEPPYPTFTLEAAEGDVPGIGILGVLAIVGMACGAASLIAQGGIGRKTAFIAIVLIAYNMVLHAIWGDEFFVYSQHWITPFLVLLAGLLVAPPKIGGVAEAGLAALLVAIAWNNETVLHGLIDTARAAAGLG